jgi:hypothetical protein
MKVGRMFSNGNENSFSGPTVGQIDPRRERLRRRCLVMAGPLGKRTIIFQFGC